MKMSNDLISRSALLQKIQEDKEFLQKGLGNNAEYAYMSADSVMEKIKSTPTVYDVDKVAERLRRLCDYEKSRAAEYDEAGRLDLMDEHDAKSAAYRESIRIVKSGGIE